MADSTDVLFLVPPMKPLFRPVDVIYSSYKRYKTSDNLIPVQLGLLSMAAYLQQDGFSCKYHDLCHFKGYSTLSETISHLLKKYNPSIVGLTSYTSNFNATLKVVSLLKQMNPNVLICVGGPHVTFLDKYSIDESDNNIDIVVRGEGEKTMRDLVYNYLKGKSLEENVKGITTKEKRTPDRALLTNEELSKLPPIALDLIPTKERSNIIYIPLNATRGCSYSCSFCTNPVFWQHQIRFRNPETVIEELLIAEDLFRKRSIEFTDTILPYKISHFGKLVELYLKTVTTPITMALTRANLTDNKRLGLMKKLLQNEGYVIIGVENGAPKILELMKKPTWEMQLQALKNLKKFDLTSIPSWMLGFCGENLSTMQQNFEKINYLNKSNLINSIILFIWIPIPGSLPFHEPQKWGVKIHTYNWDYYDRAVFPPPYSLFNPQTGETTLTDLQIWAYYLSILALQKSWSDKKKLFSGKEPDFRQFLKQLPINQKLLYYSPAGEASINSYDDLYEFSLLF
ncbi:MAG: B12-binding domain-containing radical SAM protein [Candidatus Helarchaeota archaeon]